MPQRQKASNLQKRKGLFPNLLLQFKWRVNRKQTRSPEEVCRHMHFCQEGSILEEGLRWWHVHNINVVSVFFFQSKLTELHALGDLRAQQLLASLRWCRQNYEGLFIEDWGINHSHAFSPSGPSHIFGGEVKCPPVCTVTLGAGGPARLFPDPVTRDGCCLLAPQGWGALRDGWSSKCTRHGSPDKGALLLTSTEVC